MTGVNACPTFTTPITDASKCKEATKALGYGDIFDETQSTNTGETGEVCNYCSECDTPHTRVSSNHGRYNHWICVGR